MQDLEVNAKITIPASELDVSFARSGGPGGQNVNKVNTKVILRWSLAESVALTDTDRKWLLKKLKTKLTKDDELVITSSKTRVQSRNIDDARERLAETVRDGLKRPKKRKKTKPSKASKAKRLSDKRHRSKTKQNRQVPDD